MTLENYAPGSNKYVYGDYMGKYDEWEEIYRRHRDESLPWELGRPRPILVDLIESGVLVPHGKALDACCGLGTNTIYIAKSGFETTGIDISETAIQRAKLSSEAAGTNIQFYIGSAVDLPFKDGQFDFVFDMGCFHHILPEDRIRYTEGIHRVLKKKGHYLVVCFSNKNGPAWNHFSRSNITTIFSPYFRIISIKHFSSLEGDGLIRFFYASLMIRD